MSKYKILAVLFTAISLSIIANGTEQSGQLVTNNIQDSVNIKIKSTDISLPFIYEEILDSTLILELKRLLPDTIKLEQMTVANSQLDSILDNTTNSLKSKSDFSFFITFMKCDDNLYFEIFESTSNNYLFDIKKEKDSSNNREYQRIYGFLKYNDMYIYVLLYYSPCTPKDIDLINLLHKTGRNEIIEKSPKGLPFLQAEPRWLYKYFEDNIRLLKSSGDKGFFTNP